MAFFSGYATSSQFLIVNYKSNYRAKSQFCNSILGLVPELYAHSPHSPQFFKLSRIFLIVFLRYLHFDMKERCINLWGVVVLELDSHPDYNKGPDQALYAGT